jgi:hypothetical protein
MIIAQQKEKENIAEYILYMWQIEDIIRSNEFDLQRINQTVIDKFQVDRETKLNMKLWYQNLIEMMMKENLADSGHLKLTTRYIDQLQDLHHQLLTTLNDRKYQELFFKAKDNINAFTIKAGKSYRNDVDAAFHALYSIILLKLKGKKITPETQEAIDTIRQLIAYLSAQFNKKREGKITLPKQQN